MVLTSGFCEYVQLAFTPGSTDSAGIYLVHLGSAVMLAQHLGEHANICHSSGMML